MTYVHCRTTFLLTEGPADQRIFPVLDIKPKEQVIDLIMLPPSGLEKDLGGPDAQEPI